MRQVKIATNEMIKEASKGDRLAQADLLACLEPLIISSIRKYHYRINSFEDLLQEGRILVLDCLRTYDPAKGAHFLAYAKLRLRYFYLEKNRSEEASLSLDMEDGEGLALVDGLKSTDDTEGDFILRLDLQRLRLALKGLTAIERQIVLDFYIENKSLKVIAQERNISYRTAINNKARAMGKLKEALTSKIS